MTRFIIKLRILFLLLVPALFVTIKLAAPPPVFDNSVESMTDPDDPALKALYDFRATFGSEEDIFVGIEANDVFDLEVLRTIEKLTAAFAEMDNVVQVISVASARELVGGEGELSIRRLMPVSPKTPTEAGALRDALLQREIFRNWLVSEDARVAGLVIRTSVPAQQIVDGVDFRSRLTDESRRIAAEICATPTITACHVVGPPLVKMDLVRMSQADTSWFLPVSALLIVIILALVFRSATAVILSGLAVYVSLEMTMGLFRLSGRLINMVSVIITPLILVIGLTAAIHLFSRYGEELKSGRDKQVALLAALGHVGLATVLTAVTTAAGFLSLAASPVVPIREFGVFAAIGILITLVVSMTFLPSVLSFLPAPRGSRAVLDDRSWTGHIVGWYAELITHRRLQIWIVSCVLVAIAVVGMFRIQVETYLIEFFPRDHPLHAAYLFVNEHLSGVSPLEMVFTAEREGTFKEPEVLHQIDAYRAWLAARPEPGKVVGLTDLLKELNRAVNGGGDEYYRLPETRAAVAQYLLLYESSGDDRGIDIFHYVTDDFRRARLSARLHLTSSAGFVRIHDDLLAFAAAHPIAGVDVRITGAAVLYANMVEKILQSQIRSFGLALAVIFLVMTSLFRSLRVGIVAMIPNLIPIAIAGGVMGWSGIDLTVATAMIASVAIGIAVDDTIHFLVRFKSEYSSDPDYLSACRTTITTTGRPVIFTSLVITAGFLILCTSSFRPNLEFGILTAVAMISAMIADLSVTPAALILFKPIRPGGVSAVDGGEIEDRSYCSTTSAEATSRSNARDLERGG